MVNFTQCNHIISQYISHPNISENVENNAISNVSELPSGLKFNISNFEMIHAFLNENKENLINISKFNVLDRSKKAQEKLDPNLASLVERANINHKFVDRVYNADLKLITNLSNFYMERLSIVELLNTLLNCNNLPILGDTFHNFLFNDITNKCNLINDILETTDIIILHTNSLINFLQIDVNEMNNNKIDKKNLSKDVLQLIFWSNTIYIDNLLKLLTNLIINFDLPVETISMWFSDKILIHLMKFNSFIVTDCVNNNLRINENFTNSFHINLPTNFNLIETIQLNSILFLNFNTSLQSIDTNCSLFNDLNSITQLIIFFDKHLHFLLNESSMIIYFWSFLLYTKSVILKHEHVTSNTESSNLLSLKVLHELSSFDTSQIELLNGLTDNTHELYLQLSKFYGQLAELNNVLDNIDNICDTLHDYKNIYNNDNNDNVNNTKTNANNFHSVIISSLVIFMLNFMPINTKVSIIIKKILNLIPTEFKELLLISDSFMDKLNTLKIKLPLINESLYPLINITSGLASFADFQWDNVNTYASLLKLNELDYDIYDESEDMNSGDSSNTTENEHIILRNEVLVKPPFEKYNNVLMNIPKYTKGMLLKLSNNDDVMNNSIATKNSHTKSNILTEGFTKSIENDNIIVIFLLNYNGWSFIGRILQNLSYSLDTSIEYENFSDDSSDESNIENMLISLIDLVTTVISADSVEQEASNTILKKLSNNTEKNENVIDIVFKIYEAALNKRNYPVLVTCSKFLNALMINHSDLVWSYLSRSTLFDKFGKTGLINIILGTLELESGNFEFTLNLSVLVNLLLDDAIDINSPITSLKLKKEILNNFVVHFIHIFESCHTWRFNDINQRSQLFLNLIKFFDNILLTVHSFEGAGNVITKAKQGSIPSNDVKNFDNVIAILSDSSSSILKAFLCTTADAYSANALVEILILTNTANMTLLTFNTFSDNYTELLNTAFKFTNNLIAIRDLLKLSPSVLEKKIFSNAIKLVEIFTELPFLKENVIDLFLYVVSFSWNDEYPFLLSYLGEKFANKLLQAILSDLRSPLKDYELLNKIFIFIKCSIQSKQDGLAILFLTGKVASKSIAEMENADQDQKKVTAAKDANFITNDSVLYALKEKVLEMDKLPEMVICSLLDAIAAAFKSWIHTQMVKNDSGFINALMKKFNAFVSDQVKMQDINDNYSDITYKCRSISTIVEIFALYLYMIPDPQSSIYKMLNEPNLYSKLKPFFEFDNADLILQAEVVNNFNTTYPKFLLDNFKSVDLSPSETFSQFINFDISLMNKMFHNDVHWVGDSTISGLKNDIEKFQLQSRFHYYQISAAKSWGALLTTFVHMYKQPLSDEYINIATNLLKSNIANKSNSLPLSQEKIELVFYILYSFQKTNKVIPQNTLIELFKMLLQIFKSSQIDYVSNIVTNTNSSSYRSIIRSAIIILSLVQSDKEDFMAKASDEIFEFFELSFCKGIYSIFSNILITLTNNRSNIDVLTFEKSVQDLFLLLSLFNKIKELNPSEKFYSILASSIYEVGTIRVLLNIYSNAHLIKIDDEPLIGHLSLSFITELCTVPVIAQKLINNGLFVVLIESPLSVILQNESVRPENFPKLHNIWTNDLLAIVLLLLSNFGKKILPEVCLFISTFKNQFKNCILSWSDNKLTISNALIRETSQMIMLQSMLEKLNYKNYLKDNRIRTQADDYIELLYGLDDELDRKQLSITLNKLLTHPKYLNSRIIAITTEEQILLKDDSTRATFVQQINRDIKALQQSLI